MFVSGPIGTSEISPGDFHDEVDDQVDCVGVHDRTVASPKLGPVEPGFAVGLGRCTSFLRRGRSHPAAIGTLVIPATVQTRARSGGLLERLVACDCGDGTDFDAGIGHARA